MLRKSLGFTLIELLVVITLIGVLAVAVLSALNPIEQINKARDAGKRADSSQLLTAIDRYFASNEKFPWNNYDTHNTSVDLAFAGTAEFVGVGVCGEIGVTADAKATNSDSGGCADNGYLITTQELKAQFGKRPYFKTTALDGDKLYLYKAINEPSVSVCFVPASKATRDKAADANTPLKDLGITGGVPTQVVACAAAPTDWSDLAEACFVCIPEE
ncbi:MAG: type II secretion system protein [Patescibacteria group bacterium]|nr:type II secretion system protein [Patescibacteria group bacterium]